MKRQIILTALIVSLTIFISACSKEAPAINTGFFKDYSTTKQNIKPNLATYKKVKIVPVAVIPAITLEKQTVSQKKMYKDIENYLTKEYTNIVTASGYTVTNKADKDTFILESAISMVEVHPHDKEWNQLTPIAIGLDVVSFNAYMYQNVRLLGEMRLVDAISGHVIGRNLSILKDNKILLDGDNLEFKNLKLSLDNWLKIVKANIQNQ